MPKLEKIEKITPKILFIFQEVELFSSKIKKFLIFQEMELSRSNMFFFFPELELSILLRFLYFRKEISGLEKRTTEKKPLSKSFLYFLETPVLIFWEVELSYIS